MALLLRLKNGVGYFLVYSHDNDLSVKYDRSIECDDIMCPYNMSHPPPHRHTRTMLTWRHFHELKIVWKNEKLFVFTISHFPIMLSMTVYGNLAHDDLFCMAWFTEIREPMTKTKVKTVCILPIYRFKLVDASSSRWLFKTLRQKEKLLTVSNISSWLYFVILFNSCTLYRFSVPPDVLYYYLNALKFVCCRRVVCGKESIVICVVL